MSTKPDCNNAERTSREDDRRDQLITQYGFLRRSFESHCIQTADDLRKLLDEKPLDKKTRSRGLRQLAAAQKEFEGKLDVFFKIVNHLLVREARTELRIAITEFRKALQLLERIYEGSDV